MFGAAQYEVADGIEVYAKGMFTRSKVQLSLASSGMFGDTWQLPLNNPFLPDAVRSEVCASNAISAADCAAAGAATSPNDPAYREEIGRAHVCTHVTNAHLVCRLLLEKNKHTHTTNT